MKYIIEPKDSRFVIRTRKSDPWMAYLCAHSDPEDLSSPLQLAFMFDLHIPEDHIRVKFTERFLHTIWNNSRMRPENHFRGITFRENVRPSESNMKEIGVEHFFWHDGATVWAIRPREFEYID